MAHVQFLAVCLIWGASFILMKKAYVAFGAMTIAGLRAACGAAILLLLWHVVRRGAARRWPLHKAHLPALLLPGVIGFAYPYIAQPHLIGKHQDSAYFGMMVSLIPLITIVVSVPMLGIWPRWRQLIGVLLGLACLAVLAGEVGARDVPWYDFALAATVPLAYAISNTYIKQRFHDVPPMALTCSTLAIASLVMLPPAAAAEPLKSVTTEELFWAAAALAVLGVVGSGLAMHMFYRLIQSHGPLFAGMVTYLVPLGALVWGWLDAERVTVGQLAAMGGIFAGVALVQWRSGAAQRRGAIGGAAAEAIALDPVSDPTSENRGSETADER